MTRPITDYTIMLNGATREDVEKLHELTGEFKDRFLEDHELQDLLLNDGYDVPTANRPTSLRSYTTSINGMKVCGHLGLLDCLIGVSTIPDDLVVISYPHILLPGETDNVKIETSSGKDLERIERIQIDWMENHESRKLVREYQKKLESASEEYTMQFILGRIQNSRHKFMPQDSAFAEVRKLNERVKEVFEQKVYQVLDNAYYNKGTGFFRSCAPLYERLAADGFGKNFILTLEEENKFLRLWQRPLMSE